MSSQSDRGSYVWVVQARDEWVHGVFSSEEALAEYYGGEPEAQGFQVFKVKLDDPEWKP